MNRQLDKLEEQLTQVATTIEGIKKSSRGGKEPDWKKVMELDSKLYYLRVALGFVILNKPKQDE